MDLILFEDDYANTRDIESGLKKQPIIKEEKLYVAVGKDFKDNESLLCWAIQNSGGRFISIVHVHQPDSFIPILGEKYHWSSLKEHQVKAYRGIEKQFMLKTLDEYLHFCHDFGVQAEKLYIEMDSFEKGILQLIAQYNIEKLVMGAAADGCYHKKMMEPMSQKAIFVQLHAPVECHIWFICKGNLIHQRKSSPQAKPTSIDSSNNIMSLPMTSQGTKYAARFENLLPGEGSSRDRMSNGRVHDISSMGDIEANVSCGISDLESDCASMSDVFQSVRSIETSVVSPSHMNRESTANQLQLQNGLFFEDNYHHHLSSPHTEAQERLSDNVYTVAVKKSNELEEELKKVKTDRDKLREGLQDAMVDKLELEAKVANYEQVIKQLEEGIISNVELLEICERERDGLKIERDNVLKTAEELLNQSAEASSTTVAPRFFATFTFSEIKKATNNFDPSLQLWEGEQGSIYEGVLSQTQVTIKIWDPDGPEGPREFQQEVEILSKFRHPNVATLIGVCPEAYAVVYECFPCGSLQERLNSPGNTSLSWKTRIRIATELCCALIFLHSRVPERIVHGSLKPASIFLDSNCSCKLRDFGFARIISHDENSVSAELPCSSSYTDPQYFLTGVATPASDVYSFGLILLELLTGKPAFEVTGELVDALDENSFNSLLDTSAGDWPFVQAEQLAQMALRCCAEDVSDRPDLESEVWRVLEPMRTSSGGSTSDHLGDEEHHQAPSYFMCPIFQEVMKDPHVAADGYTYEAEALQGWIDSGHDTSPMTNLQLEHTSLIPNHALRSAIQEWRERH